MHRALSVLSARVSQKGTEKISSLARVTQEMPGLRFEHPPPQMFELQSPSFDPASHSPRTSGSNPWVSPSQAPFHLAWHSSLVTNEEFFWSGVVAVLSLLRQVEKLLSSLELGLAHATTEGMWLLLMPPTPHVDFQSVLWANHLPSFI